MQEKACTDWPGGGPNSCSVCLEAVNDASERSIAKLACGHQFHLDCIGSTFNAKGSMQCPNCRYTEDGRWLYANNCGCACEEIFLENTTGEEENDLLAEVRELPVSDEQVSNRIHWYPYGLFGPSFPEVGGLADDQRISYAEDDLRVQQSGAHSQQEARDQRQHPYTIGYSGFHHPEAVTPISEGVDVGLSQDRWMWPHVQNVSTVHPAVAPARYHGRRQQIPSARSVRNRQESRLLSVIQNYPGQATTLNPSRASDLGDNLPFTERRQGTSTFWQQTPITSNLYGAHGILGSERPTQAQFPAPAPPNHSETAPGFQVFQHYSDAVEVELELSLYQSR